MELDEENIEDQKPRAPCTGLRKELKGCILESDCVKKVIFNWIHTILSLVANVHQVSGNVQFYTVSWLGLYDSDITSEISICKSLRSQFS